MKLSNYDKLICSLPVREQCFTTKRSTWKNKNLPVSLFTSDELTVSRQDVFNSQTKEELLINTVFWGYPRGMRGSNLNSILTDQNNLMQAIDDIRYQNITKDKLLEVMANLHNIKGLSLSTYSKLLYFLEVKVDNCDCVILDQRIINVFSKKRVENFEELSSIKYGTANKFYARYIELIDYEAGRLQTRSENIELFLFAFAGNLKEI